MRLAGRVFVEKLRHRAVERRIEEAIDGLRGAYAGPAVPHARRVARAGPKGLVPPVLVRAGHAPDIEAVGSDGRTRLSGFVGNRTVGHPARRSAGGARAAVAGATDAATAVAGTAGSSAARDGAADTIASNSGRYLTGATADSRSSADRTRRGFTRDKRLSLARADQRRDQTRYREKTESHGPEGK